MVWQIYVNAGGLINHDDGMREFKSPKNTVLRMQHKLPCLVTILDWVILFQSEGHTQPKKDTGNKFAQREVSG